MKFLDRRIRRVKKDHFPQFPPFVARFPVENAMDFCREQRTSQNVGYVDVEPGSLISWLLNPPNVPPSEIRL